MKIIRSGFCRSHVLSVHKTCDKVGFQKLEVTICDLQFFINCFCCSRLLEYV